MAKKKTSAPTKFEVKESFAGLIFKIGDAYKNAQSLTQSDIEMLKTQGFENYFQPKSEESES